MSHTEPDTTPQPIFYRAPVLADGPGIHALVRETGSLDVNSTYSYLLLATHFADTCAVAIRGTELSGFVSGYFKPTDPSVLFIWQVAVHPEARGHGMATALLGHVLDRPACSDLSFLEATVTPSNDASLALFQRMARDRGAGFDRRPGFHPQDFGPEHHEPESLVRIGPFRQQVRKGV